MRFHLNLLLYFVSNECGPMIFHLIFTDLYFVSEPVRIHLFCSVLYFVSEEC